MQKTISLFCALIWCLCSWAADVQPELNVALIPDSLKKNAHAVVRYSTTVYDYKSATSGLEKHSIALTILDKKGEAEARFSYPGDRFRSLSSFSGKMYDANGNLLKKYKIGDVSSTEWSESLATGAVHYSFECSPPSFPFTIVYDYEVSWKDGVLTFPAFFPQSDYNLSVEKANYQLLLPENVPYRSKALHLKETPSKSTQKGITTYEWSVSNLPAIETESYDPDLDEYVPLLYVCPQDFIYDKVPGSITDWKTYGKWVYELTQNRDALPDEFKTRLLEKTKNAATDREKVKLLYDFLGETTHYVSIQLGIGGYQPMLASEVCKTNFADCKGLTNYLKAMLTAVGIPSNYSLIRFDTDRKTLFPDYPSFNEINHVILQVPLHKDTLWLECTNPKTPFGFAHNGISGHDVLVCTAEGGKLQRVTDYPDTLNLEQNNAQVELNPEGGAQVSIHKEFQAKIYDSNDWFPLATNTEQAESLRKDINIPNVVMGNIQFKEDKTTTPKLPIDYAWSTPQYGTKTGSRLFVPVNPLRSTYDNIKKSRRVHDLQITTGFRDVDSIRIRIPEGFEIESIPAPISTSTPFGSLASQITSNGKEILIKQSVFVASGKYDVSGYVEFIAFFDKISTAYKGKIILKKKVN